LIWKWGPGSSSWAIRAAAFRSERSERFEPLKR
jgi:hypothetical protein